MSSQSSMHSYQSGGINIAQRAQLAKVVGDLEGPSDLGSCSPLPFELDPTNKVPFLLNDLERGGGVGSSKLRSIHLVGGTSKPNELTFHSFAKCLEIESMRGASQ